MRRFAVQLVCLAGLLVTTGEGYTQQCDSKYISLSFRGITFDTFARARFTPENECVTAGYLLDFNGAAHLAKFNRNATVLWSNYYTIGYFTFYDPTFLSKVHFNDFILTPDGGTVVAGEIERYYDARTRLYINKMALLAKIDKYGNVVWSKTYLAATGFPDLSFSNVALTVDGDFIAYLSQDNGATTIPSLFSYNMVVRYSSTGQLKWATNLYTGFFHSGGKGLAHKRAMTQLANSNIAVADVVYKTDPQRDYFQMNDGRIHFYSLDYNTGNLLWESDYPYNLPAWDPQYIPDIQQFAELPGGGLAITTSLYTSTPSQPSLNKRPIRIITDRQGQVQKVVAYSDPASPSINLVDVAINPDATHSILFKKGNTSLVTTVGADGIPVQTNAYNGNYPANCLASGNRGYGILMSSNQSLSFQLLLTDEDGNADCLQQTASIVHELLTPQGPASEKVVTLDTTYTQQNYRSYFVDYGYPLQIKGQYPLTRSIECEQPMVCCKDINDTLNITDVRLCEGSTYRLPDQTLVKDSGTYYVVYKTTGGCDSITYFRVKTDKSLAGLTIGRDTCLLVPDTIRLKATEGYQQYNWVNSNNHSSEFTVYAPGIYWVQVTNICGTRRDSIEILSECEFPIYMPNAFTPNADRLNDEFGVPALNKNRLLSLKIYNRWGNLVFETNNKSKKWDGQFRKLPAPSGVYVYELRMEGLSGNKITRKGTVLLIR